MKFLTTSIVIGPLMLIGTLPATAAQPPRAIASGAPVRLVASDDAAAGRDTYAQKARDDVEQWQRKLDDFSKRSADEGKEVGNAAERDLNAAWTEADTASRKLQTVGADGWASAQASYEKASHDLAATWHKINPEDK